MAPVSLDRLKAYRSRVILVYLSYYVKQKLQIIDKILTMSEKLNQLYKDWIVKGNSFGFDQISIGSLIDLPEDSAAIDSKQKKILINWIFKSLF